MTDKQFELEDNPVDLLFYDLRTLIELGHAPAAHMYVDALEKKFKALVEIPF